MIATRSMQRANAIPEMALVLSLVMMTLFGIIQYALVGYNQISADGAAFVGDHATVAQYSDPTTTNGTYAQQVALANFPHATATYTATIPHNNTYEMDVTTNHPAIGMLQLFPSSLGTHSRIIEPSITNNGNNTPEGQCANAAETLTYNRTPILNKGVTLLGNDFSKKPASTLFKTVKNTTTGQLQVVFDGSTISGSTTASTALGTVSQDLTATASTLSQLSTLLQSAGPIATPLAQGISAALTPLLNSAGGGTYSASGGGSITATTPIGQVAFNAQETATVNAINLLEKTSNLLPTVLGPINTLLYGNGSQTQPGLLAGGPNGGILGDLNAAQNILYGIDNSGAKCP